MIDGIALIDFLRSKGVIKELHGDLYLQFDGWTSDSRCVEANFLFCVLSGTHIDARSFVTDAEKNGATALLSQEHLDSNSPQIIVSDVRKAIAATAEYSSDFAAQKMNLMAVTGTNGKTTIAMMLYKMLNATGMSCAINGTILNGLPSHERKSELTTPGPEELHKFFSEVQVEAAQSVILEASSHALQQDRLWGLNFDVAIFTNLSQDHLDYHGDMETYFQAKLVLFEELQNEDGVAIINRDDAYGEKLYRKLKKQHRKLLTYGKGADVDCRINAETGELINDGTRIVPAVLGEFNLYNAAAACLAARTQGIELGKIKQALESFQGVAGRMEVFKKSNGALAVVDFAHTPDALEKVLKTLRESCAAKLSVIFGCGGDRDKEKRSQMGAIAEQWADEVILTNDNPRTESPETIVGEIQSGFDDAAKAQIILDRQKAIEGTWQELKPGDILLVAGKGHEEKQILADQVLDLSDRNILKQLSEKS